MDLTFDRTKPNIVEGVPIKGLGGTPTNKKIHKKNPEDFVVDVVLTHGVQPDKYVKKGTPFKESPFILTGHLKRMISTDDRHVTSIVASMYKGIFSFAHTVKLTFDAKIAGDIAGLLKMTHEERPPSKSSIPTLRTTNYHNHTIHGKSLEETFIEIAIRYQPA